MGSGADKTKKGGKKKANIKTMGYEPEKKDDKQPACEKEIDNRGVVDLLDQAVALLNHPVLENTGEDSSVLSIAKKTLNRFIDRVKTLTEESG